MQVYKQGHPIVSVVMASYNRVAYLERSINSYLNQTFKNSELVFVDDGSTDGTFDYLQSLMQKHQNIRYLRHSNRNVSMSKNAGILAAIGKYIAFLDSDDAYLPDYLEKRIKYMEAQPHMDFIESNARIIGNPWVKDFQNPEQEIHLDNCHIGATFFTKKSVLLLLGGFNPEIPYGADAQLWEQAQLQFNTTKLIDPSYIYYRDTPDSICNNF